VKPRSSTSRKGRDGEDRAVAFLEANGYRVLKRNLRLPGGEIDLLCIEGATLVFAEVKRRDSTTFGSALGAVDAKKRTTICKIAVDYAQIVAPHARIRFDVVALDGNRITLHRNAF
jgi:putative endonuclease